MPVKMKLSIVFFIVIFALLASVYGLPAKGSTKAALKKKPACLQDCDPENFKPICAGDGSGKGNISFGSECVLSNFNCENQKSLKILSPGECPGGGSIRLQ